MVSHVARFSVAVLLFGDHEDHDNHPRFVPQPRTSSFAASAGLPPIICVFLLFSGT